MLKGLIATAVLGFGLNAMAKPFLVDGTFVGIQALQTISTLKKTSQDIIWRVGESANYSISSSFGKKGTMTVKVASETDDAYWVHQNIYFQGQKQNIEVLLAKDTGAILKYIENGEEQKIPDPDQGDVELIDMREDRVTVPAGTFDCLYIETKSKEGKAQVWLNSQEIPVFGLIKQIQTSSFGSITIELVSFKK